MFAVTAFRDSVWGIAALLCIYPRGRHISRPHPASSTSLEKWRPTDRHGRRRHRDHFLQPGNHRHGNQEGFRLHGQVFVYRPNFADCRLFCKHVLQVPAAALTISVIAVLIFSAYILFDVSRIVNGGETNYVMATLGLYLDIYNIFVNLLQLLMAFSGERD